MQDVSKIQYEPDNLCFEKDFQLIVIHLFFLLAIQGVLKSLLQQAIVKSASTPFILFLHSPTFTSLEYLRKNYCLNNSDLCRQTCLNQPGSSYTQKPLEKIPHQQSVSLFLFFQSDDCTVLGTEYV